MPGRSDLSKAMYASASKERASDGAVVTLVVLMEELLESVMISQHSCSCGERESCDLTGFRFLDCTASAITGRGERMALKW